MYDADCVRFLQWALPRLRLRWRGFRSVRGQVCKRLARRCRALGLDDLDAYRRYLDAHPEEWQALDGLCRVTISRFYRDRGVFAFLEREVLPQLARDAVDRGGALTAWSAGCASGEEPYTLALVWQLGVAPAFPRLPFDVLGTDVDPVLLDRAQAARYPAGSLRNLPEEWRRCAFSEQDGLFLLRRQFLGGVTVLRHDLRAGVPDGPFDLVLCRNLAFTYYDPRLQREIAAQLAGCLRPGGALVLGAHEALSDDVPELEAWSERLRVYRRRLAEPQRSRRAVARPLVSAAVRVPADGGRPLRCGKIPVDLLAELLAELPSAPSELRLGPGVGEDACAIEVAGGLLVAASDPITLTSEEIGRLSVIVNANDVAVTGARPRWFLAVILVPPGTSESVVRRLFADVRRALVRVGAHLVGGHTEVTAAVTRPVVVGQMLGLAEAERFVATGGVGLGSVIVQVGPAPVEGAAVLAREAADRLDELDPVVLAAARAALDRPGISVVEPALLAARLGAAALHDPTEGGLAAGLHEMAHASSVCLRIDRSAVLWFEPGIAVCRALGADPWSTLASGTLLAAFPAETAEAVLAAFADHGHPAAAIGSAEPGSRVVDTDGHPIAWPERDEVDRLMSGRVSSHPTPAAD